MPELPVLPRLNTLRPALPSLVRALAPEQRQAALEDVLPRLSDEQLRNYLGLPVDYDLSTLRAVPNSIQQLSTTAQARAAQLAQDVVAGHVQPDNDHKARSLLEAVRYYGVHNPLFKALELYDRNIGTPFTAMLVDMALAVVPGEQGIEKRTKELMSSGQRFDQAARQAFEESKLPGPVKFGLTFLLDPLVVLAAAKGLKTGLFSLKSAAELAEPSRYIWAPTEIGKIASTMGGGESAVVRPFMKYINPSATVKAGSAESVVYAREALRSQVLPGLVEVGASKVRALGLDSVFKFSKTGEIELGPGRSVAWNDVMERTSSTLNPYSLNPQQLTVVGELQKIPEQAATLLRSRGIEVDEIALGHSLGELLHYFPRAIQKEGRVLSINPTRTVGLKQGFEKSRFFDEASEAIRQGYEYKSPVDTIRTYLRSAYSRVIDKDFTDAMRPFTTELDKGGKGLVQFPSLTGKAWVDVEQGRKLEYMLRATEQSGISALRPLTNYNDYIRTLRTTFDMGGGLIQGLPLLFYKPLDWARAQKDAWGALLSPTYRTKFITKNGSSFADFVNAGGIVGSPEFLAGLEHGGWFAKVMNYVTPARAFTSAFETNMDAGKLYLWKALKPTARGVVGDERTIASFANKMLGIVDTKAMGVSATQRQLEGSVLFFSARYNRASAALIADVFRGGMRGSEARDALGNMLAAGQAFYRGFAHALGQEPNLDPTESNFMKVRIGDTWLGPGTKFRNLLLLASRVSEQAFENPRGFMHWNMMKAQDYKDNPILSWIRSANAPATGSVIGLLTGSDAIGRTIPMDDPTDWAQRALQDFSPFWAQAAFEEGALKPDSAVRFGGEFAGLITTPVASRVKRDELRDKLAQAAYKRDWNTLDTDERFKLRTGSDELKTLERATTIEESQFVLSKRRTEFSAQLDTIDKQYLASLDSAAAQFMQGGGGGKLREAISNAGLVRSKLLEQANQLYGDVTKNKDLAESTRFDLALGEYMDNVFGNKVLDEFGNYNFRRADLVKQEMRKRWGDEIVNRVEKYLGDKKADTRAGKVPEVVAQYYRALATLRPYFDIWKQVLSGDDKQIYGDFLLLPSSTQAQIRASRSPLALSIQRIDLRIKSAQLQLQQTNPDVDEALVLFFDRTPHNILTLTKYR